MIRNIELTEINISTYDDFEKLMKILKDLNPMWVTITNLIFFGMSALKYKITFNYREDNDSLYALEFFGTHITQNRDLIIPIISDFSNTTQIKITHSKIQKLNAVLNDLKKIKKQNFMLSSSQKSEIKDLFYMYFAPVKSKYRYIGISNTFFRNRLAIETPIGNGTVEFDINDFDSYPILNLIYFRSPTLVEKLITDIKLKMLAEV